LNGEDSSAGVDRALDAGRATGFEHGLGAENIDPAVALGRSRGRPEIRDQVDDRIHARDEFSDGAGIGNVADHDPVGALLVGIRFGAIASEDREPPPLAEQAFAEVLSEKSRRAGYGDVLTLAHAKFPLWSADLIECTCGHKRCQTRGPRRPAPARSATGFGVSEEWLSGICSGARCGSSHRVAHQPR
jgi:hypothetical protein